MHVYMQMDAYAALCLHLNNITLIVPTCWFSVHSLFCCCLQTIFFNSSIKSFSHFFWLFYNFVNAFYVYWFLSILVLFFAAVMMVLCLIKVFLSFGVTMQLSIFLTLFVLQQAIVLHFSLEHVFVPTTICIYHPGNNTTICTQFWPKTIGKKWNLLFISVCRLNLFYACARDFYNPWNSLAIFSLFSIQKTLNNSQMENHENMCCIQTHSDVRIYHSKILTRYS